MKSTQLLATYAREAVREYLHIRGNTEEGDDNAFSGFRVSADRVAQSLVHQHPNVFSDDLQSSLKKRQSTLKRWLAGDNAELAHLAERAAA